MQPANLATPATARSRLPFVQERRAPAGDVMVNRTELAFVATVAPEASCTVTAGCDAKATPPVEPLGCRVNANRVAGRGGTGGTATAAMPTIGWLSEMPPVEPWN